MAIDSTRHMSTMSNVGLVIGLRLTAAIPVLFASTVFSSAFLLFLVQPLLGKYILPWFGGSPSVWTTCMLIFQALLFFGYGYAHLLSRFSLRRQANLHVGLLLAALCTLPITPSASWKPIEIGHPAGQIIVLLMACVGLPYFLLSATGPLLQAWFVRAQPDVSPYRLYALSNAGSLLALVAYPFVIERWLTKPHQTVAWSIAFALFAVLCSACAALAAAYGTARNEGSTQDSAVAAGSESAPTTDSIALWFALSMIASMYLLATTNQVCLDVAVIPFLWVIPLALYLLTFILCFDGEHWYSRRLFMTVSLVTMPVACFFTLLPANGSLVFQLGVYFTALFAGCMVCHGELVRLKPPARYLTLFYMTISAGGSCGGLFVGLLAPAIFTDYFEFQLAILGFGLLSLLVVLRGSRANAIQPLRRSTCIASLVFWAVCVAGFGAVGRRGSEYLDVARNFYGTVKVAREVTNGSVRSPRFLVHGRIVHGAQNMGSLQERREPTTYYGRQSGIGLAFAHVNRKPDRHVGVIGLGVGTLAAYGREGDRFRFYEINPTVVEFARTYFSFLGKSPAKHECVVGDARLMLERESPQAFDLLVLDAFSGDAIPVHLLTSEAFEVYLRHLAPSGLLACHVSNVHFDLVPVLAGIADKHGLSAMQVDSEGNSAESQTDATWILLCRNKQDVPIVVNGKSLDNSRRIFWSDDQNNLFDVLTR
jgi:hypothetical protein